MVLGMPWPPTRDTKSGAFARGPASRIVKVYRPDVDRYYHHRWRREERALDLLSRQAPGLAPRPHRALLAPNAWCRRDHGGSGRRVAGGTTGNRRPRRAWRLARSRRRGAGHVPRRRIAPPGHAPGAGVSERSGPDHARHAAATPCHRRGPAPRSGNHASARRRAARPGAAPTLGRSRGGHRSTARPCAATGGCTTVFHR